MVIITGGLHLYDHSCGCCNVQEISITNIDFQKLLIIRNSSPPGFTGKAFLIFTHTLKIPLSYYSQSIYSGAISLTGIVFCT